LPLRCLFLRYYEHLFLFSMLKLHVTSSRFCICQIFIIFAKYLSLYLHIFTCTYRGTNTRAHMYNQHTRGMATTRHRSLVERNGRKALLETLHTHKPPRNGPVALLQTPRDDPGSGRVQNGHQVLETTGPHSLQLDHL